MYFINCQLTHCKHNRKWSYVKQQASWYWLVDYLTSLAELELLTDAPTCNLFWYTIRLNCFSIYVGTEEPNRFSTKAAPLFAVKEGAFSKTKNWKNCGKRISWRSPLCVVPSLGLQEKGGPRQRESIFPAVILWPKLIFVESNLIVSIELHFNRKLHRFI